MLLTGCTRLRLAAGLRGDEPNENININKINELYHVDFIVFFVSI